MLHKKAKNNANRVITSLILFLVICFSFLYVQSQNRTEKNVEFSKTEVINKDTIIKQNPTNGTYTMTVPNEDGTTTDIIMEPEELVMVMRGASGNDSAFSLDEDRALTLTIKTNNIDKYYDDTKMWPDTIKQEKLHTNNEEMIIIGGGELGFVRAESAEDTLLDKKMNRKVVKVPQVYHDVEKDAEYPGGEDALIKFIGEKMDINKDETKEIPAGVVFIQFVVNADGRISNVKSVKTPKGMKLIETKAIEAVNEMPNWKPAQRDGKNVNVYFTLPISFEPELHKSDTE